MRLRRRTWLEGLATLATAAVLPGCANLMGHEPVRVNLVGLEPLPGEGIEVRMTARLRVQNPNDFPLEFNGIWAELDVDGATLASGVSAERGTVPPYAEAVLAVPVSISAMTVLRQALGLAQRGSTRVRYALRGRLRLAGGGSSRFSSSGDVDVPGVIGAR